MAGRGPAQKDPSQRARRNATIAMTKLPRSGRKAAAPKWPLGSDVKLETAIEMLKLDIKDIAEDIEWGSTARDRSAARRRQERAKKKLRELEAMRKAASATEKQIWTALWKTPQATQWELRGWFREVALYARHQAKAEAGSLDDSKEARMREDRLGLNDRAMKDLKWEIIDDSGASTRPTPRARRSSSRYGDLRVVK